MFNFGFDPQEYINNLDSAIKNLENAIIWEGWSLTPCYFFKRNMGGVKEVTLHSDKNSIFSSIKPDSCVIQVSKIRNVVLFVSGNGYDMVELHYNTELDEYMINDVSSVQMQMEKRGYNITHIQAPVTKEDLFNLNLKYDMVSELFSVMKIVQDNIDVFYKELEEDF